MTPEAEAPIDVRTPPRGVRIAVVDDHRLVLDGLSSHLRFSHPDLRVVATATSWSALLAHPEFPVDVVVLDRSLGDGVPVETKIRTLATAGIRTVVMSRHAHGLAVQSALNAGALAFVPKTDGAAALVQAIRAAASGGREPSGADEFVPSTPALGRREMRALMLYAAGRTVREVAEAMETTEETVKSYLKRGRRKYRAVGIDLGTRPLLRQHAVREGWVDES